MKKIPFYCIRMLLLGVNSGMMFTLISFTIPYQLIEIGYSTAILGAIFLAALPYCLKPIYAPFVDRYSIKLLCEKFGHRRGWLMSMQLLVTISIALFLFVNSIYNIIFTIIISFIISFFAATQDVIIDAYRIECSPFKDELTKLATFNRIGFSLGMLFNSTGVLYLSHMFNWYYVYIIMIFISTFMFLIILSVEEPFCIKTRHITSSVSLKEYFSTIKDSVLLLKQRQPNWMFIALFIILYKASDSIPMAMSSALFVDLSFTANEIASISKAYGLILMIIGNTVGGIIASKISFFRSLLICGGLQLLSPLMFMFLSIAGHDITMFIITISIQNFCCGVAGTALVIYFSSLCNSEFVATQYSIITSFGSLVRIVLSFIAAICVSYVEWWQFFLLNALVGSLFILALWMIEGVDLVERVKVIFSVACWVWGLIIIATAIYLSPYILATVFCFICDGIS